MLPSGLPEIVSDDEHIVRFIFQSGDVGLKQAAFLPAKNHETSVFRSEPIVSCYFWDLGKNIAKARQKELYGAVVVLVKKVRKIEIPLDVVSDESQDLYHANIVNWFLDPNDLKEQKAKRKMQALEIVNDHEYAKYYPKE